MDDFEFFESIYTSFFKVDENNKVLTDGKYEFYSIDGEASGIIIEPNEQGRYVLNSSKDDYESTGDSSKLIPNVLKEVFADANSIEDLNELNEYGFVSGVTYTYSGGITERSGYIAVPVVLRQIKGDAGYLQSSITFKAVFDVRFFTNDSTGELVSKEIIVSLFNGEADFVYGEEVGPITSLEQLFDLEYTNFSNIDGGEACISTNSGVIATTDCTEWDHYVSSGFNMVPYFVEEKGEVKFEVENLVNGMAKYNASKDKKLEYTIKVKNIGTASSGENVIKTYVPKEVEVNENKISDDGVYNKNDHTITWNVDYIEIGEVLSVSYEANAPEDAGGKELIGKSSIQSGQVLTEVYSTNTIVTLDRIVEVINNPNTGTMVYIANTSIGVPVSILVMFVIALLAVIVVLIKRMKKTH